MIKEKKSKSIISYDTHVTLRTVFICSLFAMCIVYILYITETEMSDNNEDLNKCLSYCPKHQGVGSYYYFDNLECPKMCYKYNLNSSQKVLSNEKE